MRYTPPFQLQIKQRTSPPTGGLSLSPKSLSSDDEIGISLTPVKYHHHIHDHYIHAPISNICKVVICCIMLCMMTYYCLYITFFSTNIAFLSDNINAQTSSIEIITLNIPNITTAETNNEETTQLNAVTDDTVKIPKQKRRKTKRRKKGKQQNHIVGKHKPFPPLYISDAPYYMDKNVVITGLVRDSDQGMDAILTQLESVACLFNSTTFIFFESNSNDNSLQHLRDWKQSSFDCTKIALNPKYTYKYENTISSLDQLINVYNHTENDFVDTLIIHYLKSNYMTLEHINLKDIANYLTSKLRTKPLTVTRIEEIIYFKLAAIKFITYQNKIEKHNANSFKYVISGDNQVANQLAIEEEIVRQMKIFGSLNELHTNLNEDKMDELNELNEDDFISDYNGLDENGNIKSIESISNTNELDVHYAFLKGIKDQELRRHSYSDFVDEFGNIHDEVEELIGSDAIIKKHKRREKRKERILNAQTTTETPRFRGKLFRIERFVIYRNMLLNKTHELSNKLNINFDYILTIDMDIYSIDIRTFMNELYFMPDNIDGLCIDGIDWMGYTRDTFATVKINGGWLHYGHDSLVNNAKYIYNNDYAMEQRTKVPNHEENRYEEVKSCFGGIMIYKNFKDRLVKQQCKYTLTRDIFYTHYNNSETNITDSTEEIFNFNYTYDYWLNNRYHNDYSEQSMLEMKLFIKQYMEMLQVFDKTVKNRELIPKDGDICEHIPYHYCLWDKGFKFAISSRAKLYYDKFYPKDRTDTNWRYYSNHRLKFTKEP